jgi:hypothetical protein
MSRRAGETRSLRRTAEFFTLASILLLTPLQALAQGYAGPSLLSRGGNTPGRRGNAPVNFTYYGAVRGLYETGLIAPVVDDSGNINGVALRGVQLEVGAYGAKSWRRSSLGLDYRGDYRKTNSTTSLYNGVNQALSLDYLFQPTNRLTIFARETGGTTNRAFGAFSAPAFVSQQNQGVPLNEVYDSRVYFSQTTGGVSYRISARTQVIADGVGFFVKRTHGLIGMQGFDAGGAIMHQLDRSNTVGLRYDFIRFEYPRVYGGSDINMASVLYNRRMTRSWQIRLEVGVFRSNSVGTQEVELSPEVALILGRPTGVEAFDRTVTKPRLEASSLYTFKRSSWSAAINSGPSAGNGIYLASTHKTVHTGYSYTGFRKLSFGVSGGYTTYSSLGLTAGNYSTAQGGGGANYRLARHLDLSFQLDHRWFNSPGISGRSGTGLTFGLSFTPASIPLSIW